MLTDLFKSIEQAPWYWQVPCLIAVVLATFAAIEVAAMIWRWWRGKPVWPRDYLLTQFERLLNVVFMAPGVLLLVLAPKGWSFWFVFALMLVASIPTVILAMIGQRWVDRRKRRLHGVDTGKSDAETVLGDLAKAWDEIRGRGEQVGDGPARASAPAHSAWRETLIVVGALVLAVGSLIGGAWLGGGIAGGWGMLLGAFGGPLLLAGVFFFPRWPGLIERRASLLIEASPQAIWETLRLRETASHYRTNIARVEKRADAPERYALHYRDLRLLPCPRCASHHDPERIGYVVEVEIVEKRPGVSELHRTLPMTTGARWMRNAYRQELDHWVLAPEAGGTRITYTSIVDRPRLFFAIMARVGNPSNELLVSLKARMEGRYDPTMFGNAGRQLKTIRESGGLCPGH